MKRTEDKGTDPKTGAGGSLHSPAPGNMDIAKGQLAGLENINVLTGMPLLGTSPALVLDSLGDLWESLRE